MTPKEALSELKALKPADRWEIEMKLLYTGAGGISEDWTIMRKDYIACTRYYWEGETLEEVMEKVRKGLKPS